MCGIAGIVLFSDYKPQASLVKLVDDMCSSLKHRGPDERASLSEQNICIGMTRLAILDLRKGLYPIKNEKGDVSLFYNGEVYNFKELRSLLESEGHRFRSLTDAEVIVHGYESWGIDCLKKLNGMWAFALWDATTRELLLARDNFGIKPLYYHVNQNYLIFASEIRALLCDPLLKKKPNDRIVHEYLAGDTVDHTEETFFAGIDRLPPGHCATIGVDGSFKKVQYWRLPTVCGELNGESAKVAADHVKRLFVDAVRIRMVSDVPVGTCLSGGLDSSSIVGVIARLNEQDRKSVGNQLQAFSAFYRPGDRADESHFARRVAEANGVKLNAVYPSGREFWDELEEFIDSQEEPFVDTSQYAQWKVMQIARAHGITVLLDGQGADEVFAGYPHYIVIHILDLLKSGKLSRAVLESLRNLDHIVTLIPRFIDGRLTTRNIVRKYLNHGFATRFSTERIPNLAQRLWHDTAVLILPSLLRYEDKSSMHFSIEARLPFLDPRLVEYAASLPTNLKIRDGWTKYILRLAFRDFLPEEIAYRRDKIGFETPQQRWFIDEIADHIESVLASDLLCAKYVNQAEILSLFRRTRRKKTISQAECRFIWRCICLEFWLRRFTKLDTNQKVC
jgi:asparagine synthase (glutamine-hydrolysing)